MSPALCDYGFKGYKYRLCSGGVLGEIQLGNCTHIASYDLLYSQNNNDFVLDLNIKEQIPSYTNVIARFSVDHPLPTGLSLNAETDSIRGKPTVPSESTAFVVRGENPVGAVTTTIYINVRKGKCVPDGDFRETEGVTRPCMSARRRLAMWVP